MDVPPLVIVVRHAQSEHHVRGLTGGWTDTPLTPLGHEQARRLAARLRAELGDGPIRLYTSDLIRARETAEHLAAAFGAEPIADERLREHNNGEAADLTLAEARARWPDVFGVAWPIDFRPFPGAETGREFYARAGAFLDGLPAEGPLPVLVTHGNTLITLVARWLRLTPEALEPIGFSAHPTGITVLVRDRFGARVVERLNDVAHLAGMEGWVGIGELLN